MTRADYVLQIWTAVRHIRFWLGKLGLDAAQRRLFWLALAERELTQGAPLGKAEK